MKKTTTSIELLGLAKSTQEQRAIDYGQPGGERSMEACVNGFNALTGHQLPVKDGWLFMTCLKIVRDQAAGGHEDSCLDFTSYAALYGEASLAAPKVERVVKDVPAVDDPEEEALALGESIGSLLSALKERMGLEFTRGFIAAHGSTTGKLFGVPFENRKALHAAADFYLNNGLGS